MLETFTGILQSGFEMNGINIDVQEKSDRKKKIISAKMLKICKTECIDNLTGENLNYRCGVPKMAILLV